MREAAIECKKGVRRSNLIRTSDPWGKENLKRDACDEDDGGASKRGRYGHPDNNRLVNCTERATNSYTNASSFQSKRDLGRGTRATGQTSFGGNLKGIARKMKNLGKTRHPQRHHSRYRWQKRKGNCLCRRNIEDLPKDLSRKGGRQSWPEKFPPGQGAGQ